MIVDSISKSGGRFKRIANSEVVVLDAIEISAKVFRDLQNRTPEQKKQRLKHGQYPKEKCLREYIVFTFINLR